ncbi:MAG: hypothetical protein UH084_08325 [Paludibacteraceae bacterium]|nr:hypothetical protein [Paludibacteraceae bacterium]
MKKPAPTPPHIGRTCGECKRADWDMTFLNLDIHGKPTLKKCPLHPHKRIRSEQACEKIIL